MLGSIAFGCVWFLLAAVILINWLFPFWITGLQCCCMWLFFSFIHETMTTSSFGTKGRWKLNQETTKAIVRSVKNKEREEVISKLRTMAFDRWFLPSLKKKHLSKSIPKCSQNKKSVIATSRNCNITESIHIHCPILAG